MKAYILTLAGAILLSALLSVLLPGGKIGKFLKGVGKLLVFSVVAAPLVSLFAGSGSFVFPSAQIGSDEGYLRACAKLLEEEDEREIARLIEEEFSLSAEVFSERGTEEGFPRRMIRVKIEDPVISSDGAHINTLDRVRAVLEERYGCETEVLWRETG